MRIPLSQPLDWDGDGINDAWELQHAPALNPFDPADAVKIDPAGGGLTYLQEFQREQQALNTFEMTASGLNLKVGSGRIGWGDGTSSLFPGTTLTLQPNRTNHVVIDQWGGQFHSLVRGLGDGQVKLAEVVTDSTRVIDLRHETEFKSTTSRVERTKRKLFVGEPVQVVALGDSLTSQRTQDDAWFSLLFETDSSPTDFVVPNAAQVTPLNEALGGVGPDFGFVLTGRGFDNVRLGKLPTGAGQGFGFGAEGAGYWHSLAGSTPTESPLLSTNNDLVIIGYFNTVPGKLGYIEQMVRDARAAGSEVILWAAGPQLQSPTGLEAEGAQLRAIADAAGAAFCDVWSLMREQFDAGQNPTVDGLHLNAAGYALVARAMRSILNDHAQNAEDLEPTPTRVLADLNATDALRAPEVAEVVFQPGEVVGGTYGPTVAQSSLNPALRYGGRAVSNAVITLTAGQYVRVSHPLVCGMALLVEANSSFNATVRLAKADITTVNYVASSSPQPWVVPVLSSKQIRNLVTGYGYGQPAIDNFGAFIIVNSGTLKLIGTVFYTLRGIAQ